MSLLRTHFHALGSSSRRAADPGACGTGSHDFTCCDRKTHRVCPRRLRGQCRACEAVPPPACPGTRRALARAHTRAYDDRDLCAFLKVPAKTVKAWCRGNHACRCSCSYVAITGESRHGRKLDAWPSRPLSSAQISGRFRRAGLARSYRLQRHCRRGPLGRRSSISVRRHNDDHHYTGANIGRDFRAQWTYSQSPGWHLSPMQGARRAADIESATSFSSATYSDSRTFCLSR